MNTFVGEAVASVRYSNVAVALHWLIAAGIITLIYLGLTMTDLKPFSPEQFRMYQLHKSIGITVLGLSALRLAWRLLHTAPPLPAGMARWERLSARGTHLIFYVLMFFMPLTGWAMVSASPLHIPTVLYGVAKLPNLPWIESLPNPKAVESVFGELHENGGWVLIALIALHIAAALKHQFIARDNLILRMLPW